MKNLKFIPMIALGAALSSCVYETGAIYPDRPNPPNGNHYPGSESRYYREGIDKGREDARRGRQQQPSRYWGNIPRTFRDEFTRGYSAGYGRADHNDRPGRPGSDGGYAGAYLKNGRDAGVLDQRRGLSYQPSRHWNSVPSRFRDEFSRGYAEGFRTRPGRR